MVFYTHNVGTDSDTRILGPLGPLLDDLPGTVVSLGETLNETYETTPVGSRGPLKELGSRPSCGPDGL